MYPDKVRKRFNNNNNNTTITNLIKFASLPLIFLTTTEFL